MLGYAFTWLKNSAVGAWEVNVVTGGALPQKVASAMSEVGDTLIGAQYEALAYLGKQQVNGINHAVLAAQTVPYKEPLESVVILKFNEKGDTCSLVSIEPLIQSGPAFGGYRVCPMVGDALDETSLKAFREITAHWLGTSIRPVALLATKVTKGVDELFLCTVTPVYPGAVTELKLVRINGTTNTIDFEDVL